VVRKPTPKDAPAAPTIESPAAVAVEAPETATKVKRVRKRGVRRLTADVLSPPLKPPSPSPLAAEAPEQSSEAEVTAALETPLESTPPQPVENEVRAAVGLRVPAILLEGDEPTLSTATGPGQKFVLGPPAPVVQLPPEKTALPESYGTGRLLLAARDPHWLYAHWDLTAQQQSKYNALSVDRHLVVRVAEGVSEGGQMSEVHVHPESRHWFIHAEHAAAQYVAELGYYRPRRRWVTVASSTPAVTPPERPSADRDVRFATIPAHRRLTELVALAKQAIPAGLPPVQEAREDALAELIAQRLAREAVADLAAAPELAPLWQEAGALPAMLAQPAPLGGASEFMSSAMAPVEQRPAGFWLNVNADLVIYGATEPGASVTIGGRPLDLRPDGTFSYRYTLPDGEHSVTLSAMSAEGEMRQATLMVGRRTDYQGDVGATPPDPTLEPPRVEPQ
jgi:uncharacterized protein